MLQDFLDCLSRANSSDYITQLACNSREASEGGAQGGLLDPLTVFKLHLSPEALVRRHRLGQPEIKRVYQALQVAKNGFLMICGPTACISGVEYDFIGLTLPPLYIFCWLNAGGTTGGPTLVARHCAAAVSTIAVVGSRLHNRQRPVPLQVYSLGFHQTIVEATAHALDKGDLLVAIWRAFAMLWDGALQVLAWLACCAYAQRLCKCQLRCSADCLQCVSSLH